MLRLHTGLMSISKEHLLVAAESVVGFVLDVQHEFLAVGRQVLGKTLEIFDGDYPAQFFLVEIINILVGDEEVSLLAPVVLVPLLELDAHQQLFRR